MALTLIKGAPAAEVKPAPDYKGLYLNAFMRKAEQWKSLLEMDPTAQDKDIHKQLIFYGIRFISLSWNTDEKTEDAIMRNISMFDCLQAEIGALTPRELTEIFPIEKRFDGHRWGVKDYFFTMNELQAIGMDTVIGDKTQELLWDFENSDIRRFTLNRIEAYSEAREIQTGQSIAEAWAEKTGLKLYHLHTDVSGRQYVMDRCGRTKPTKKKRPRYLRALH